MTLKTPIAPVVAFICMIATAGFAQGVPLTNDDVSDTQIKAFVVSLFAVERLRQSYLPRIAEQESEEGRDALIAEVTARAKEIVDKVKYITPAEYKNIADAAQTDTVLAARIKERVDVVIAFNKEQRNKKAAAQAPAEE